MEMTHLCGCIGYGYVPMQQLNTTFKPDEALCQGSLFPELVLTIEEYGMVCKREGKAL